MQQEQPPLCRCGYENSGNYCPKCGVGQPKSRNTPARGKFTWKPAHAAIAAASVIGVSLLALSLLIGNSGADTDTPPRQADQTEEPDALELVTANHLNHRIAQAFAILGLKYDVELDYNDLLAFFRETTLENEEFMEEVSPIEIGLFELLHDEYDYANEAEEAILKQGESPRKFLLELSQAITSTKGKETTSPTTTRKSE